MMMALHEHPILHSTTSVVLLAYICSNMGVRIFSNENRLQMYVQVHFDVQVRT